MAYTQPVSKLTPAQRAANAAALARAVLAFCVPCWALGVLLYAAVGRTFARDRAAAAHKARR